MRIIGVIGAMNEELEEFHNLSKNIIVMKSGVGKVNAAMVCQKIIDKHNPAFIISTGVAGALNPTLDIGDVVLSKDCLQHDMDARGLGVTRGTIPYINLRTFRGDQGLINAAMTTLLVNQKIIQGRILTGDQFFTNRQASQYNYLIDELKGDAIDMETAAIGQVCTINEVPFLSVRTISDKADGSAKMNFEKFLPILAKNSFYIVKTILENELYKGVNP